MTFSDQNYIHYNIVLMMTTRQSIGNVSEYHITSHTHIHIIIMGFHLKEISSQVFNNDNDNMYALSNYIIGM